MGPAVPDTANLAGGARRELSSTFSPSASDFWIIDLTTQESSATNALDLADATWAPYLGPLPTLFARFYMHGAEVGNTFTLHTRASGGTEQLQSVVVEALNAQLGSS